MFPDKIEPHKACDQGLRFDGDVRPSWFERLASAGHEVSAARASLAFDRDEEGRYLVSGDISADLVSECQRCMLPMKYEVQSEFQCAVVWSDEQAKSLPGYLDPWKANDGVLDIPALLEEELLLALPVMQVHDEGSPECKGVSHYSTGVVESAPEKVNPFAKLAELKDKPLKN